MILEKISNKIRKIFSTKQEAEYFFWKSEIVKLQQWYSGELKALYNTACPDNEEKVEVSNLKDSSVLTWFKLHQQVKYLEDLELTKKAFVGKRLLDIGAGPMPSATVFEDCEVYCLDPLFHKYLEAGYPLHYYGNCRFIHACSENIPVEDGFFDAVISVNAIDHVDDLFKSSEEIRRVLKDNGLFRMHVHYHAATKLEPLEIDDDKFLKVFSWCTDLKKMGEKKTSHSTRLDDTESFALWSNFIEDK